MPDELVFDLFGGDSNDELVDDDNSDGEGGMDLAEELQDLLLTTSEVRRPDPPDPTRRSLELARAYIQMGLTDAAITELEKCRAQGPLGIEAMRMLGTCHFKRGAFADAVYWYQAVLNRNDLTETQELEALFELGLTYEAKQDFQRALDLFEEIASLNEHFRRAEVQSKVAAVMSRLS